VKTSRAQNKAKAGTGAATRRRRVCSNRQSVNRASSSFGTIHASLRRANVAAGSPGTAVLDLRRLFGCVVPVE